MRYVIIYRADGSYSRYPIANAKGEISTSERVSLNKKCGFVFENVNLGRFAVTDIAHTDIDEKLKNFCSYSGECPLMSKEELARLKRNSLASLLKGSSIYGDVWFFKETRNGRLIAF